MNTSQLALASSSGDQSIMSGSGNHGVHSQPVQWIPVEETLHAIFKLLRDSTSSNSKVQANIFGQLQQYAGLKDFNNYLVYILAQGYSFQIPNTGEIDAVRQAAGLLLKSNIRHFYINLPSQTREYMNAQLLAAIGDTSNIIRAVATTCISTVVVCTRDIGAYSGLITTLVQCLDSNRPTYLDGALTLLSHLAEEVPHLLDQDVSRPLDMLLPKIMQFCHHQTDSVRARSLQVLNHLLLVMPSTLYEHVDAFCQTLFSAAEDSSAQVRKRVCTAICLLLETSPNALAPYMKSIVEYMLKSSQHPDELIAREASEFWSLIAADKSSANVLRPYLRDIVPILLKNMVYSDDEIAQHDATGAQDVEVPDRQEDIRPRFHQPRFKESMSFGSSPGNGVDDTGNNRSSFGMANGNGHASFSANGTRSDGSTECYGEDSDNDSEDWDDFQGEADWNLRKCSATALDAFSGLFGDELLEILLPMLEEKFTNSERWEQRECGVLTLGAIAEGCYSGMQSHMRSILPFLFHLVADQHYMVRTISCWTLSRYSKWVISERDDSLFRQTLKILLDRIVDQNKLVQRSACSALASFAEECGPLLSSYLTHILQSLNLANERYQQSNLIVLYDIVCTLADAVGSELANPEHLNALMPMLTSRWNAVADSDAAMLSLLECLSHVFRALGMRTQQFAGNIFSRCVSIMDAIYTRESHGDVNNSNTDFLTCSLDLMCALSEALGPNVDPFISNNGNGSKSVLPLLFVCMKDRRQEVRQSAFALLGELARGKAPSLIPALPEYVRVAVDALNPEYMSVSNNATWALGELVMMAGFLPPSVPMNRENIQRTLMEGALDSLIRVVITSQLNKSLLENSALTIGRMGLVMPEAMAPRLGMFAKAVFASLRNIRDDVEKEQAFHGMNAMVKLNHTAILDCFVYYVDAIGSWFHCKPDLEMEFASILNGYKATLGEGWFPLLNSFPTTLQNLLKERFSL